MKKIYPILFFVLILASVLIVNATTITITLTTNRTSYARLDNMTVSGSLSMDDQPVTKGLVAIQIDKPNGDPLVVRTVNTGVNPTYPDPVDNPDFLGQVLNLYPSDIQRNPVSNFNTGGTSYFTLTVQNIDNDPRYLYAVVNVYDNNNIPIGIAIAEGEFAASSQSTITCGIPIPTWATPGRATAFAAIYTLMPRTGGRPFSLEASTTFTINGVQGNPPPTSQSGSQGNYILTFQIPPKCPIGTYNVYTSVAYRGIPDTESTSIQIHQPGDLDGNGTVDFDDLLTFVDGYIAYTTPPYTLDPKCDFDHNGVIDFDDVLSFVDAYIQYGSIP